MKKKHSIFIILLLIVLIGIGIYFYIKYSKSNNKESDYQTEKAATETNNSNNASNSNNNGEKNTSTNINSTNKTSNNSSSPMQTKEEELIAFSTKIYSNDNNRTTNMKITTSTLDGTIVKNGETFSFCNTVGPATSDKGYLEADIYDSNGNKKKGYGGGNCQVSSTLYNAVLSVPNLTIVERHPHSNYVPYVEKGKDAAVAYGSYDFKFTNNTGNDIKILSSVTDGLVNVTLMSITNRKALNFIFN